jgi:signal transduction histidine kinase
VLEAAIVLGGGAGLFFVATQGWLLAACVLEVLLVAALAKGGVEAVPLVLVTAAPWWVGRQIHRRGRLLTELAERTWQLEAEERIQIDLAVRSERGRIARELHDVVAHHLAVIVIQAGAGRMTTHADAAADTARLRDIAEASAQALSDMSRLVDVLAAADHRPAGLVERLQVIVERARRSGLEVDAALRDPREELPPAIVDTVAAVVQEALTNVVKHARGAQVRLTLDADGDWVAVEIANGTGGASTDLALTGSGIGLTGMRERVEACRGTFKAGMDDDGGWLLRAVVPSAG